MKKSILAIPLSIAGIALYAGLALAAETSPLADAIAKQLETAPQSIDMQAAPGYLGIPGGPQTNMLLAFGWALWVGWIFSTVGAFGGVMAGVGHMSVHGLGAYAKSFGQTPLNKSITDSVRASNQMLAGLSAALSTFSYYRLKRIVLPLGIALGLGSIVGAFMAVKLTAGKLNFSSYQGYFGLFVLLLGCYLMWETSPAGSVPRPRKRPKLLKRQSKTRIPVRPWRPVSACAASAWGAAFSPSVAWNFPSIHTAVRGRHRHFFHCRLPGRGRWFPAGPFPDQHHPAAHVSGRRDVSSGRAGEHDYRHHDPAAARRDRGLVSGGAGAGGHRCGVAYRPLYLPFLLRHLAEAPFHRPCLVCGHGLRLARLL